MKTLVLYLVLPAATLAQPLSAGLRLGVPLSDAFTAAPPYLGGTNRFTIGPTLELRLPFRFGLELDALYRRYEYTTVSGPSLVQTSSGCCNSSGFDVSSCLRSVSRLNVGPPAT